MITFSNIVRDVRATENNNNVQNCNIEFKPDKKATKSESVGLDISLVTSPIEENKNFETSEKVNLTESVTFSGLVRQDNKSSEKKFGIQASSDDNSPKRSFQAKYEQDSRNDRCRPQSVAGIFPLYRGCRNDFPIAG